MSQRRILGFLSDNCIVRTLAFAWLCLDGKWQKTILAGALIGSLDLRIALESLFLPEKPQQELKFRLAASGAWLVGEDPADRRRVWDSLRNAYDLASAAVHQGDVKMRGSATVLAEALAVCRRGLLRAGVATVPGDNFYTTGRQGERYLRFALCRSLETLQAAIDRLRTVLR